MQHMCVVSLTPVGQSIGDLHARSLKQRPMEGALRQNLFFTQLGERQPILPSLTSRIQCGPLVHLPRVHLCWFGTILPQGVGVKRRQYCLAKMRLSYLPPLRLVWKCNNSTMTHASRQRPCQNVLNNIFRSHKPTFLGENSTIATQARTQTNIKSLSEWSTEWIYINEKTRTLLAVSRSEY